ncbi:unnamed protein product, partial [marine sediment metagenome]
KDFGYGVPTKSILLVDLKPIEEFVTKHENN